MEKLTYYSCAKRKTRPISMLFFSISWLQTYYSNIKQPSSSCSRGEQFTCIHTIQYSFIQLCFISQGPSIMCIDSIVQSEIPRMRIFCLLLSSMVSSSLVNVFFYSLLSRGCHVLQFVFLRA